MYVIGTAGHVDHGKSTLVHALTGIDPDRLPEEKARSMTIDLGFAWLRLPSGEEVSIVDVPGHERFVRNMLAGVGGIDIALLVIAADEGVMPQTREHLAILDLLQVKKGIVVITKKDLVDKEWLELVTADVTEVLKDTVLAGSTIVAVSGVTREGLPELVSTIQKTLVETPPKKDIGRPRLPIDRIFTISGFGTVVTGTLIDGTLTLGQEVEMVPGDLRARVRGLQTHRTRIEVAQPGSRVAANLSGVAPDDLRRGQVVTTPGWLRASLALDARLRTIKDIPHPLQHNSAVTFHTGTSESTARVRLLDTEQLQPGEECWVQIRLDDPIPVVKGDRFILRSSQGTLGGGEVVEPFAKRHQRFSASTLSRLAGLERGSPEDALLAALEAHEPCNLNTLVSLGNLSAETTRSALEALVQKRRVVALGENQGAVYYSAVGWERLTRRAREGLEAYHRQFPLRKGSPKEELRSRLGLNPQVFNLALSRLLSQGTLLEDGALVRLPSHQPRFSPQQQQAVSAYLRALESSRYSPPTDLPLDSELLNALVEQGRVVKVSEDVVFAASVYEEMVQRIVQETKARGKITVAEVRDLFGTSRKYALALMEHLDQQRITRRIGDERVLR